MGALNKFKKKRVVEGLSFSVSYASKLLVQAQSIGTKATRRCRELDAIADESLARNKTIFEALWEAQLDAAAKRADVTAANASHIKGHLRTNAIRNADAADARVVSLTQQATLQSEETSTKRWDAARACQNASDQADLLDSASLRLEEAQASLKDAKEIDLPNTLYEALKEACEQAKKEESEAMVSAKATELYIFNLTAEVNGTASALNMSRTNISNLSLTLSLAEKEAELISDPDDKATMMEKAAGIAQQLESKTSILDLYRAKLSEQKVSLEDAKKRLKGLNVSLVALGKKTVALCGKLEPLQRVKERKEAEKAYRKNLKAIANAKAIAADKAAADKEAKSVCAQFNATARALFEVKITLKEAMKNATRADANAKDLQEKLYRMENTSDKVLIQEAAFESNKAQALSESSVAFVANLTETKMSLEADVPILEEKCKEATMESKDLAEALIKAKRAAGYVKPSDDFLQTAKASLAKKEKDLNASASRSNAICSEYALLENTVKPLQKAVTVSEQVQEAALISEERIDRSDEEGVVRAVETILQANESLALARDRLANESKWLSEYARRCAVAQKDMKISCKEYDIAFGLVRSLQKKAHEEKDVLARALNEAYKALSSATEDVKVAVENENAANNSLAVAQQDLDDASAAAKSSINQVNAQADVNLAKLALERAQMKQQEAMEAREKASAKMTSVNETAESFQKTFDESAKPEPLYKKAEKEAKKLKVKMDKYNSSCTNALGAFAAAKQQYKQALREKNPDPKEGPQPKPKTEAEQKFQMFQLLRLEQNASKWENVSVTECSAFQAIKKAYDEVADKAGFMREAEGMSPWDIMQLKYSKMREKIEKEAAEAKAVAKENLFHAQKAYDAAAAALEYTEVQQENAKIAVKASGDWLASESKSIHKDYAHIATSQERLEANKDWLKVISGNTAKLRRIVEGRFRTLDDFKTQMNDLNEVLNADRAFINDAMSQAKAKVEKATAIVKEMLEKKQEHEQRVQTATNEHDASLEALENLKASSISCTSKSLVLQADCRRALQALSASINSQEHDESGQFTTDVAAAELNASNAALKVCEANVTNLDAQNNHLTILIEGLNKNLSASKKKRDVLKSESTRLKGGVRTLHARVLEFLKDQCKATFFDNANFTGEIHEFTTQLANPSEFMSVLDSQTNPGLSAQSVRVTPGCASMAYPDILLSRKHGVVKLLYGDIPDLVLQTPVKSLTVFSNNITVSKVTGRLL